MQEHVILVAVTVEADDRATAETKLYDSLPDPGLADRHGVTSWWIAEDDRRDGSDNDSAVFVHKGRQQAGFYYLAQNGLVARHSAPSGYIRSYPEDD